MFIHTILHLFFSIASDMASTNQEGNLERGTVMEQRSIIENSVSDPQPPQPESNKQNIVGGASETVLPPRCPCITVHLSGRGSSRILLRHEVHVSVVNSCGSF